MGEILKVKVFYHCDSWNFNKIPIISSLVDIRAAFKIVAARLVVRGSFKIVAASIEAKS